MLGRDWEPAQATVVATRPLENWSRTNATPWEYVVDVRPPGQPAFRATFHDPLMHGHWDHPVEGEVVNVLFNPKSHDVKLADEYKTSIRKLEHADDERFRAISDAPPGSAGAPVEHAGRTISEDSSRSVNHESKHDAAERLIKVAELHDRGVLTDAEFAAAKADILAQEPASGGEG